MISGNYTLFGDYRSMLGQLTSNAHQLNQRAMSMAMCQIKDDGFKV